MAEPERAERALEAEERRQAVSRRIMPVSLSIAGVVIVTVVGYWLSALDGRLEDRRGDIEDLRGEIERLATNLDTLRQRDQDQAEKIAVTVALQLERNDRLARIESRMEAIDSKLAALLSGVRGSRIINPSP